MLLAPLHKALLQKLKLMCTFPLEMRGTPAAIGGLGVSSLEITCGAQAIHRLVSLFMSCTPSKLLLITAIEYHKLEIGVESLFLCDSHALLSKLATSTWIIHLWEFLHLCLLEVCLPTLVISSSFYGNDTTLVDLLLNSGWKVDKLRLANQTRVHLQVHFISDLLIPGSNKIKRCFLPDKTDESTFSVHDWPVVKTNKDSVSTFKKSILEISNSDGTLRQSIKWSSKLSSHRKNNAKVNADHMVICAKVSETKIRHYTADKSRSSYRHKIFPITHNFILSDKTHVYASLSDCVWLAFRRSTLNISVLPKVEITFER